MADRKAVVGGRMRFSHEPTLVDVVHSLPHRLQRQSCSTHWTSRWRERIGAVGGSALHLGQRALSASVSAELAAPKLSLLSPAGAISDLLGRRRTHRWAATWRIVVVA